MNLGEAQLQTMLSSAEDDDSVVRDLVASFLLPEVQRQRVKREGEAHAPGDY